MADVKISALPASATPLAGTEVLPIVQGTTTKQVAVSDLTAGRTVSALGITFPATQVPSADVNTLDDYEEGSWTPVFTSAAGTITSYTVNAAKYTKIGRLVTLSFDVTITNNGTGAVAINVTGLPFAALAAYSSCGTIVVVAAVGFGGFVNKNSTTALSLVNTLWAYPGGTNYRLIGNVAYNTQ